MARLFTFIFCFSTVVPLLSGCFDPDIPDTAFRCGDKGECPDGYECREDGCCHKIGIPYEPSPGCMVPPDAALGSEEDTGPNEDGDIEHENDPDAGH